MDIKRSNVVNFSELPGSALATPSIKQPPSLPLTKKITVKIHKNCPLRSKAANKLYELIEKKILK